MLQRLTAGVVGRYRGRPMLAWAEGAILLFAGYLAVGCLAPPRITARGGHRGARLAPAAELGAIRQGLAVRRYVITLPARRYLGTTGGRTIVFVWVAFSSQRPPHVVATAIRSADTIDAALPPLVERLRVAHVTVRLSHVGRSKLRGGHVIYTFSLRAATRLRITGGIDLGQPLTDTATYDIESPTVTLREVARRAGGRP